MKKYFFKTPVVERFAFTTGRAIILISALFILTLGANSAKADGPTIDSLNPTQGPVGTEVTVTGTNFATINEILLVGPDRKINTKMNLNSSDGKTFVFTVPSSNYFSCWTRNPPCGVPSVFTKDGIYKVYVLNANGESKDNKLTFTVGKKIKYVCQDDSNCGTDGFTLPSSCKDNNVYENYITHTCNNPGTPNSKCSSSTSLKLKEICSPLFKKSWTEIGPKIGSDENFSAVRFNGAGGVIVATTNGVNGGYQYSSYYDSGVSWSKGNPSKNTKEEWGAMDTDYSTNVIAATKKGLYLNLQKTGPVPVIEDEVSVASSIDSCSLLWNRPSPVPGGIPAICYKYFPHLIAATGGHLYAFLLSYGNVFWKEVWPAGKEAGSKKWVVAINGDGSRVYAADKDGNLYISADGRGEIWGKTRPAGDINAKFRTLTTNYSGSVIVAGAYPGRLYISLDGGATWEETGPAIGVDKNWITTAVDHNWHNDSSDIRIVAAIDGGGAYVTSNSGVDWVKANPAGEGKGNGGENWRSSDFDEPGYSLILASDKHLYLNSTTGCVGDTNRCVSIPPVYKEPPKIFPVPPPPVKEPPKIFPVPPPPVIVPVGFLNGITGFFINIINNVPFLGPIVVDLQTSFAVAPSVKEAPALYAAKAPQGASAALNYETL